MASQTIITNFYLNRVGFVTLRVVNGRSHSKQHHTYHHAGYRWRIDVFQEPLNGRILGRIEARSAGALAQIPIPSFASKEVTDDPPFTGGALVEAAPPTVPALLTAV